jgi:thioredoxin 1
MSVKVVTINSIEEFKILTTNNIVIVDFYAIWCGPCKMISPKFEEMSIQSKYQNIHFAKVDVDDFAEIANEYQVQSLPTFMAFKNGKFAGETKGANLENLTKLVNSLV